jgi:hypothetical protein
MCGQKVVTAACMFAPGGCIRIGTIYFHQIQIYAMPWSGICIGEVTLSRQQQGGEKGAVLS